jgi:hypothetical protein
MALEMDIFELLPIEIPFVNDDIIEVFAPFPIKILFSLSIA